MFKNLQCPVALLGDFWGWTCRSPDGTLLLQLCRWSKGASLGVGKWQTFHRGMALWPARLSGNWREMFWGGLGTLWGWLALFWAWPRPLTWGFMFPLSKIEHGCHNTKDTFLKRIQPRTVTGSVIKVKRSLPRQKNTLSSSPVPWASEEAKLGCAPAGHQPSR